MHTENVEYEVTITHQPENLFLKWYWKVMEVSGGSRKQPMLAHNWGYSFTIHNARERADNFIEKEVEYRERSAPVIYRVPKNVRVKHRG